MVIDVSLGTLKRLVLEGLKLTEDYNRLEVAKKKNHVSHCTI